MENEQKQRPDAQRSAQKPTRRPAAQRSAQKPKQRPAAQRSVQKPAQRNEPPKSKKPRMHRMNRAAFRLKLLTMLGIVAALILSFIIFFKISTIQVVNEQQPAQEEGQTVPEGQTDGEHHIYYTSEEIIAASGIEPGDNLLTLNKASVAARIKAQLPYIDEVQIKRSFPSTVTILVSEYDITYGICDEAGDWWLISRETRVLEPASEQQARSHVVVLGMTIRVPKPGELIAPVGAEGADETELLAKQHAVTELLRTLEEQPQIAKNIVSVDVSTSYDIVMWYGTQYEVRLGNADELTYKFAYLQGVLEEFERENRTYLSGVIDITFAEGKNARFRPFG